MGYELMWEPPSGLIKSHFGQVAGREVLEANRRAEADFRFDSLRWVINDFSKCTEVSVTPAEVELISAIDRAAAKTNPSIRIAIVATHQEVVDASIAYANDSLTPFLTKVFNSIDDARLWLGLSAA